MSMNLVSADQKALSSFWGRREGKWGMGAIALMAVGGVVGLNVFGGAILGALTLGTLILGKALMLTALGVTLAIVLFILFGTNIPKIFSYWFKAATRRLAGVFVAVYPVEIIREFVAKLKRKQLDFKKNKEAISGVKRQVTESKLEVESEKKQAMMMLKAAAARGDKLEADLQAQIIMQNDETLQKYLEPSIAQMTSLYERLARLEKVIDYKIRGMENQAVNLERQNKTSKITRSAMGSAWAILRGSDPDQELYDMAVENIVEDHRATLGMVDDFMHSTEDVLRGFDLKTGMWTEQALAQLAELEQKEQMLIAKTPEANIIVPNIVLPQGEAVGLPASNTASKYFN